MGIRVTLSQILLLDLLWTPAKDSSQARIHTLLRPNSTSHYRIHGSPLFLCRQQWRSVRHYQIKFSFFASFHLRGIMYALWLRVKNLGRLMQGFKWGAIAQAWVLSFCSFPWIRNRVLRCILFYRKLEWKGIREASSYIFSLWIGNFFTEEGTSTKLLLWRYWSMWRFKDWFYWLRVGAWFHRRLIFWYEWTRRVFISWVTNIFLLSKVFT